MADFSPKNGIRDGMNSTAFLVLAHRQPEMLARLLGRLRAPGVHTFVHIDARMPLQPFLAALGGSDHHTLLQGPDRQAVHWCGFTMVEATVRLLRWAFYSTSAFRRFCLLSGADYPIRPIEEIGAVLAADTEFIQVDRRLSPTGRSAFDRCANQIFTGDRASLNSRTGIPVLRQAARVAERATYREWPPGLQIFQGPEWWGLSRAAVASILDAWDAPNSPTAWFRLSRSPDEMIFQTLLKASTRADRIHRDYTGPDEPDPDDKVQGIHFVDWRTPGPEAPATLELAHLPELLESRALFARKFDYVRSRQLMDELDRRNS